VVLGLAPPPSPSQASALQAAWQAAHGLQLPDPCPHCFEVSGDGDLDGPTTQASEGCPMGRAQRATEVQGVGVRS
jgi:hypothetical protein